jgi:hypothetical protein
MPRERKSTPAVRKPNRHLWLLEPIEDEPTCVVRSMFGSKACYFNGLLVLALCDKEEPWRGVLVPTEKSLHAALIKDFPALRPHPILPKWLYLSEETPSFESDAGRIVERIRQRDPRIGVLPEKDRPKKKR